MSAVTRDDLIRAGHTLYQAAIGSGGVLSILDAVQQGTVNVNVVEQGAGVAGAAVLASAVSLVKGALVGVVQKRSAGKANAFEAAVAAAVAARLQAFIPTPANVTLTPLPIPGVPPTVSDSPSVVPVGGNGILPDPLDPARHSA